MSEEIENKLVPKLRFPEFQKDEKWEMRTLDEVVERIEEKVNDKKLITVSISAGTGFVSQAEKFSRDISGAQYKNYIVLNEGEFSYNKGNSKKFPQGCIYKLKEFKQVAVPNAFISFRFKQNYVGNFYQGYFDRNCHGVQLKQFITSGARMDGLLNIKANEFFSIVFPTTSKPEQQKIAACLSSLDDLITAESQKLEVLKEHRKGLLQQLFPQAGETVQKLRFKEFKDSGEWEMKKLGEICTYFKGFAFQSKDYTSSGRRIVRVSDMGFDYIKDEVNSIFINEQNAKEYKRWEIKREDLIITTVGSKPPVYDSLVGRTIVAKRKDENALLNQNAVCIRSNKDIKQSFLNILFKRDEYISFIKSIIRGNANQGSIALEDLFKYTFLTPNLEEQQRMASCFSSLDDLINAQSQKVEALKQHKKGLLQGLFPTVNEITE
jgi:type I restriction enzyme S subunit